MLKKRIRYNIAFFLIVAIVVQMAYISQSVALELEPVDESISMQEDAINAYNIILENLKSGKLDENIYAGAYIDESKLIIMLTSLTAETRNEFLAVVETPDTIDFIQARYSLKYLNDQLNETADALSNYPITEYGIYESKNTAFIRVEKDYYDSFLNEMPALYVEDDIPIIFEPGEYHEMSTDKEENEKETFSDSVFAPEENYVTSATNNIKGGMSIRSSKGTGTIGFCGYYGTVDAIITAGHVVSEGEETEYGHVVHRNYGNNQYGDYAIIFVNSEYTLTNAIVQGRWDDLFVRTVYSSVPEGTQISAYGQKSGHMSAKVVATNVSMPGNNGITTRGLIQTEHILGTTSTQGDSGGPVYYALGAMQVAACGLIKGGGRQYYVLCSI